VQTTEKINKEQAIIEVAQRWFGLYGIEKTSMQDIADDLKTSKAALYYYFPDKESLYKAVVMKEQEEFLALINERILSHKEPDELLREYTSSRLSYFRKLLNLSRIRMEAFSDLKPVFRETMNKFREKEKEIIKEIFEAGINKNQYYIKDTDKTALLFLDLLKGLRASSVSHKKTMFIDEEEFIKLKENTEGFTEIFIRSLKVK
jgi:AcrR family transcriptional regulator